MSIDIQKAEDYLRSVIPKVIPLSGEINALGTYLLFNTIKVNNGFTEDITYNFSCYVAISTPSKQKKRIYDELSNVLTKLVEAQQADEQVEVKAAKPFMNGKKLLIYQLDIAVTPPLETLWDTNGET